MREHLILLVAGIALFSAVHATERTDWTSPYRPLIGEYIIYSGDLYDQQAPTRKDRKLSFIIAGKAAKEIFNAMPSDDKDTCSGEKGARSRSKENVWCTFNPEDGYTCYFGFDLQTGKSIAGGMC